MNQTDVKRFLSGQASPLTTLDFLSDEFIPAVIEKLNETGTRRRMALYGGDRVPENERNLTDVRNRMSLLIEYKLAWIANDILEDHDISDIFWTNVVANRFPDLELRDHQGHRGLRVEVKCLQAIAEEKSANFDTLKKDLNPNTDYIVVFVWEWFKDQAAIAWDRAPKILSAFIFHASSLAELRDYNWLNSPPNGLGDGHQGFDLRYAVNCRQGQYSEEEGNYGKLLRIWNNSIVYQPGLTELLTKTVNTYREFEDFTVWSGFDVLAPYILQVSNSSASVPVQNNGVTVGYKNQNTLIIFKRRVPTAQQQLAILQSASCQRLIVMNDKYQWVEFLISSDQLVRHGEGRKPKHLVLRHSENSVQSGIE